MVRSMTGYGKAETTVNGRKITVEIRSLNSKQLDLSVKSPSIFRSLDTEIRSTASKVMQRGKVDVYINVEAEMGAKVMSINEELFSSYYDKLRKIGEANGVEWGEASLNGTIMQSILRLPNVICGDADETGKEAGKEEVLALMQSVNTALIHIDEFRQAEGKSLIDDILGRIGEIEKYRDKVTPFEESRMENVKSRIRGSIEKTGVAVDANRLEQEMVYYVEKLDITEEKVRLANHCKYFREVVEVEDAPGRKLGFITQEIGREINTLGSKANDASIQRIVVAMKDELEKIKEQLLNIL